MLLAHLARVMIKDYENYLDQARKRKSKTHGSL